MIHSITNIKLFNVFGNNQNQAIERALYFLTLNFTLHIRFILKILTLFK